MSQPLSEFELDSIRETLAQGAGHASTALSQMANRKIDVTLPELRVVAVEEIIGMIGSPHDVMMSVFVGINSQEAGVQSNIGSFLLLMPPESAVKIADMMQGAAQSNARGLDELSEMDISALHEAGNILTGCSLSAISDFLNLRLIEGIPTSSRDMIQASLDAILSKIAFKDESSMAFKTTFSFNDEKTLVYLFLIFEPEATEVFRRKINELMG
jgi:chemotaxis protein CheC